jgi:hypothetical protein
MTQYRKRQGTQAASLITEPNLHERGRGFLWPYSPGDEFYEALIDAHRDLSDEQSQMLNCKLILLLANQVGNLGVLKQALHVARKGVQEG